ncbi:MAG: hypothetical protein ACHQJ6_01145 [Candidatus Berkiellales bacterium]
MFEFLVDVLATFLGGYFSQKATTGKITSAKYFFSIFFLILFSYILYVFIYYLISGQFYLTVKKILFAFLVAILVASFLYVGLKIYLGYKKQS